MYYRLKLEFGIYISGGVSMHVNHIIGGRYKVYCYVLFTSYENQMR